MPSMSQGLGYYLCSLGFLVSSVNTLDRIPT